MRELVFYRLQQCYRRSDTLDSVIALRRILLFFIPNYIDCGSGFNFVVVKKLLSARQQVSKPALLLKPQ